MLQAQWAGLGVDADRARQHRAGSGWRAGSSICRGAGRDRISRLLHPSKANQALRDMWERTRDLALNASTPLVSLVVAIFVGFALYKVFVGTPVDLRAFAGQTVIAVGFALGSYAWWRPCCS